ncbi:hypothetical protein AGMMS49992_33790 [Clostridia bacterium]|nr:hypothetical protein AGMMS49992_33790 [Clostridia bacterium]
MGAGIGGAIPLKMQWSGRITEPLQAWQEFYTKEGSLYTIKEDVLITNYRAFLTEFYDLIQEDTTKWIFPNGIPDAANMEEFEAIWSHKARKGCAPFTYGHGGEFSALDVDFDSFWLFYSGSYKAYLEEYNTFKHMELMLAKAMTNPLKDIVKFGIFG